jgi:hypothetical protein
VTLQYCTPEIALHRVERSLEADRLQATPTDHAVRVQNHRGWEGSETADPQDDSIGMGATRYDLSRTGISSTSQSGHVSPVHCK